MRMDKEEFIQSMKDAKEEQETEALFEEKPKSKRGRPKKTKVEQPIAEDKTIKAVSQAQIEAINFAVDMAQTKVSEILQKAGDHLDQAQKLNNLANSYNEHINKLLEMVEE